MWYPYTPELVMGMGVVVGGPYLVFQRISTKFDKRYPYTPRIVMGVVVRDWGMGVGVPNLFFFSASHRNLACDIQTPQRWS